MYFYYRLSVFFLLLLMLLSCQSEDISSELETGSEVIETPVNNTEENSNQTDPNTKPATGFEEYFYSVVGGEQFNAYNPEFIEAYIKVNPKSGVTSLFFFAYPEKDSDQVFGFQLCFYNGTGEYYTGDGLTNSWCYYWDDVTAWYSDIKMDGDPAMGTYTITNVSDEIIEGEFVLTAYNLDDHNSLIEISGKFGAFLEDPIEN